MKNAIRPSEALRGVRHILVDTVCNRTHLSIDEARMLADALAEIVPAVNALERAAEAAIDAQSVVERTARLERMRAVCNGNGRVVLFPKLRSAAPDTDHPEGAA